MNKEPVDDGSSQGKLAGTAIGLQQVETETATNSEFLPFLQSAVSGATRAAQRGRHVPSAYAHDQNVPWDGHWRVIWNPWPACVWFVRVMRWWQVLHLVVELLRHRCVPTFPAWQSARPEGKMAHMLFQGDGVVTASKRSQVDSLFIPRFQVPFNSIEPGRRALAARLGPARSGP